jgi:hypothetical protein
MERETEKRLQEYICEINQYDMKTGHVARPLKFLWVLSHLNMLNELERLSYALKIHSSFLFNVVLVHVIENLAKQGNMEQAKENAKLYRMDGLPELERGQHRRNLFRLRYYSGFRFDHALRQCAYLESLNNGLEKSDGDFHTLFNRELAKPNLSLNELPKPLSVRSIIEKIKSHNGFLEKRQEDVSKQSPN